MSGLCGILRHDGGPVDSNLIGSMMDAAPHRGPDGRAVHLADSLGMGYLSHQLTPDSIGETQPLVHAPTGIVVVCDLRLDNREELPPPETQAESTAGPGQIPISGSGPTDAELVLASYLKWGEECASRLLGDFACVVWDPRIERLHLLRDSMGMRNLFYTNAHGRFAWATELKQLLVLPDLDIRLNHQAVAVHLSGSHLPVGMTYYEGIAQVEPGELVRVRDRRVECRRYWNIDPGRRTGYRREQDYADKFRELFEKSVENRLRSAQPVGISLSGGMDSGSISSMVGFLYERGTSRYKPEFRAYSWAFDELTQCDERSMSRLITDRYGIPSTDIPADGAWPLKDYAEDSDHGSNRDGPYIFYYDELMDDLIGRAAEDGMGLLMTGERGDVTVNHWVYDYPGLFLHLKPGILIKELTAHGRAMGMSFRPAARRLLLGPLKNRLLRRGSFPAVSSSPGRYPSYLVSRYAESEELAASRAVTLPSSDITDEARLRRFQLIFSAMSVRRIELLASGQAKHGIDYSDPWSDRKIAEYIISIPQYIVHRFTDFKRIARMGLGPILTEPLRNNSDSLAKANPTPLFERGIYDRAAGTVEHLINTSAAARMGFVDNKILLADYRASLQGKPLHYDLWWFLTMEMWLRKYW